MSSRRRLRVLLIGGGALGALALGARAASSHGLLEPPAPALAADLPAPPALDASSIAAPVRIPVATLVGPLEGAVPRRFGNLEQRIAIPGKARTSIAFQLVREPFRVSLAGDAARLEATVGYTLRAWYDPPLLPAVSASCGTKPGEMPRLRVVIEAPLRVEQDWRLSTRSRVVSVERASATDQDKCRMTFLDFDVTDRVIEGARSFLAGHTRDIDRAAARVDLRGRVHEWWTTVQQPIHLADSLWLVFRPQTIRRGVAGGTRDSLEIALAMRARPGIVMGPRPSLAPAELPALDEGPVSPGLDLWVDAVAGYAPVSAFLQSQIGGAEIERGGRLVRIDSLRVFGIGGGRLALEVMTSGDVVSHLYLTGTPRIDPATGQFSIPDLDYDVRTRSMLLATMSALGSAPLRQLVRERASWPSSPAVGWLQARLLEGLNRDLSDDLRVAGDVEGIRILGIHAMRDLLLVRAQATGSARLMVVDDAPTRAQPAGGRTAAVRASGRSADGTKPAGR